MPFVATIIANPDYPVIDTQLSKSIARELRAERSIWLAEGIACDFLLPELSAGNSITQRLAEMLSGRPIDFAVQDSRRRRKAALIADMDSTMIDQECIDELADEAGFGAQVASITARAMNGELEFEPALIERVTLLAGLPVSIIAHVIDNRITLASGARTLVATMRANGGFAALVSGGFTQFTGPIAAKIGFDNYQANELEVSQGILTGRVIQPILGRTAKRDALLGFAAERGLKPADFMAVGDGANDLLMLEAAGSGIALHAKPVVGRQAKFRIDHGDLTALLYVQGYSRSEFVQL